VFDINSGASKAYHFYLLTLKRKNNGIYSTHVWPMSM
jgi:hypothetical protein